MASGNYFKMRDTRSSIYGNAKAEEIVIQIDKIISQTSKEHRGRSTQTFPTARRKRSVSTVSFNFFNSCDKTVATLRGRFNIFLFLRVYG